MYFGCRPKKQQINNKIFCQFPLYSKVTQSVCVRAHTHTHTHTHALPLSDCPSSSSILIFVFNCISIFVATSFIYLTKHRYVTKVFGPVPKTSPKIPFYLAASYSTGGRGFSALNGLVKRRQGFLGSPVVLIVPRLRGQQVTETP